MSDQAVPLRLPPGLSPEHARLLSDVAGRNSAEYGDELLGLVLSGSAGRGLATERSDVDVYVVVGRSHGDGFDARSSSIDESTMTIAQLERVPPFGSDGWWYRWSFAWAPVLLDRTGGRLAAALHLRATVNRDEAQAILVEHDRLDGWLNYAYRALKNDRDGRRLERRLDAVESVSWLLDVVFTLAGRVRPYNKYLPWELAHHPLPDWPAADLLPLLEATIDGDPRALRATFARVEALCVADDEQRPTPVLTQIIEAWGHELELFRQ